MSRHIVAFISGSIFAIGLAVGGMTQPGKVIAFLDFFGNWDPSLMFVMGGAVALHLVVLRLIRRRGAPLIADRFNLPTRRDLSLPLVVGSALFGVGWGLGGFCPGPAITSLPTGGLEAITFVGAMAAGMIAFRLAQRIRSSRSNGHS